MRRGNRFKDLTHQVFGELTVIEIAGSSMNKTILWKCRCSCKKEIVVKSTDLRFGKVDHCGCKKSINCSVAKTRINTFRIEGEVTYGYDTRGNEFIVDTNDLEKVKKYYWGMNKRGYFSNTKHGLLLHRYILDTPDNMVVDHRNHKTGDNRKTNIWSCTQSDNMCNQKRFHKQGGNVYVEETTCT